ncbi:uncharacterized protein [Drosophila kikkawai]|uniref:Uncharacterized protein n=1 Tax=Drosophila kikkawai TaxID=30033 RepID=A0ABM4GFR0_DROKI
MMYVRARKQLRQDSLHTSFTTAAYGSHQNVFIRLDPLGRPPSATGSYATIARLNKYPAESKKSCSIFDRFRSSPTPTPYATALLPMNHEQAAETIYSKPESICPSRISYYASSQLTQRGVVGGGLLATSSYKATDIRGLSMKAAAMLDAGCCVLEQKPKHQPGLVYAPPDAS